MLKQFQIKEDEEILAELRQYFLIYAPKLILGIVLVILSFFLLFPLFYKGWWGVLIFIIIFILGVYYAVKALYVWYNNIFIITNLRLVDIDQIGFFKRTVSEAPMENIQDVSYSYSGVIQTIFRYGKIQIQTAGTSAQLELNSIKDLAETQNIILDQVSQVNKSFKNNLDKQPFLDSDILDQLDNLDDKQLVKVLKYVKKRLGKKRFDKYIDKIDKKKVLEKIYEE